jgi:NADH:ubiquinone reductase (H+-translocating)
MARILVLGSGFAGLWAAVGGARKLAELGIPRAQVEILVVERNPYHGIRVRNYEPDLGNIVIPLAEVLDPIGVKHLTAEVEAIDVARQHAVVAGPRGRESLAYERLVLALGSHDGDDDDLGFLVGVGKTVGEREPCVLAFPVP